MSREVCYVCRRAKVACLCGRIESQTNEIKVIVLQHPDEVSNPKGSAIIAKLALKQYQCWVGEDFSQHAELNTLITASADELLLLYPAETAVELNSENAQQTKVLIVIDATWRKARRIWELTPRLHELKCVTLKRDNHSNYRIRKVPEQGYLSTVEAIVEGLRVIEGCSDAYQPLLTLFDEMIDFQIAKMGDEVYGRNYKAD